MEKIPEDIAKVANELASTANTCCYRSDGYEEEMAELIARAILAERERCATVAESFGAEWREDARAWLIDGMVNAASTSLMHSEAAYKISNYIRNPKTK